MKRSDAVNDKNTNTTRKRYNRLAPVYDLMEGLMERSRYNNWRELVWGKVEGPEVLEVGAGTGKNFAFYPKGIHVTAIDLSDRMLKRARGKAAKLSLDVTLLQMDVQYMDFPDGSFDTVIDTFVFCSVPDPVEGLREIRRVCKPGGKVLMLEHVLSANRLLAVLMHAANPIVVRMMGANINRRTVVNVAAAGLEVERVTDLGAGIFKLIEARKTV